jgi:FkbM family methyltransferase
MSILSRIRNSGILKRFRIVRRLGRSCFRFALRLLTRNKGVKIHVGKRIYLRLDYRFYFNKYENWGANHNDGYNSLLDLCQPGNIVFDVGAHIGLCALSASQLVQNSGKVIAFEPSQTNFTYLKNHIRYNDIQNTQIYPYLVGETSNDHIAFYESTEPTGMNAMIQYKDLPNATWVNRCQISIDDFCAQHSMIPDIIKIDVEGAEIGVIKGAQKLLASIPNI